MKKCLRIVSRKSTLALWQANFVKDQLASKYPDLAIQITTMLTEGDKILDLPLAKIGGKGLFVKALEEALLNDEADIAVHSLKDLPAQLPAELELCAILEREDPRDAFVSFDFPNLQALPSKARIGTSSLRRQTQLYALRSDLSLIDLRGNVDTRIQKLAHKEYDGLLLAVAGLKRLGLTHHIREYLSPEQMLPAIAQGALGIECRRADQNIKTLVASLHHLPSAQCVLAERSMNALLGGSCQLPIGGLATVEADGLLKLQGMVASPEGHTQLKATAHGKPIDMIAIGIQVAEQLLEQGAKAMIEACHSNPK